MLGEAAHIETACDGEVALDLFCAGPQLGAGASARRFDLVLLDVQMPFKDGIEAAAEMREWEARTGNGRTRIIGLSANAGDYQTRQRCLGAGMDQLFAKPLTARLAADILAEAGVPAAGI